MAIFAATDYYVMINSVDLSDWVRTVEMPHKAAALDKTTMGLTTKANLAGLKEWSLTVTGLQDYASGGPDATLNSLVGGAAVTDDDALAEALAAELGDRAVAVAGDVERDAAAICRAAVTAFARLDGYRSITASARVPP